MEKKIEKANQQVITRSRTGNLPPARVIVDPSESGNTTTVKISVQGKATAEEIKEKMEQQLRLQRAAHQQKRALEVKNSGQMLKMVGATTQVTVSQDGQLKIVKNVVMPGQTVVQGKNTLTSLLSQGNKQLAGRRIFMTKAPDGTTKVIAGASNVQIGKSAPNGQGLIKVQTSSGQQIQTLQIQQPGQQTISTLAPKPSEPVSANTPQKVQIMRCPDGRVVVKGLLPGQQLIQFPDGKLQVVQAGQLSQIQQQTTTTQVVQKQPQQTIKQQIISTPGKVLVQGNQVKQLTTSTVGAQSPMKVQQVIVKQANQSTPQKNVVVSGSQVFQQQVIGGQIVGSPMGQQIVTTNQIVINNQTLAQQLATGKVQVATINGQQVLIRPTGNNQAQIVAQLTPSGITQQAAPAQQQVQQVVQPAVQSPTTPTKPVQPKTETPVQKTEPQSQSQQVNNQIDPATMEQLLAGQPPGTVIKCVTAQVIQTQQGPRIVLQGLQGADFTSSQLAAVQQQVKQQLLKAQASTGKQGVLGPTKIYLAVQPSSTDGSQENQVTNTQPPPLAPVQQQPVQQATPSKLTPPTSTSASVSPQKSVLQLPQHQTQDNRQVVVNGQSQQSSFLQTVLSKDSNLDPAPNQQSGNQSVNIEPNKQFVVTPDYIQQTIKSALKQENLNPEIEEKLLQLQRYQEKQMKHEPELPHFTTQNQINNMSRTYPSNRKRPPSCSKNDDMDWVLETPKRNRPSRTPLDIRREEPEPEPVKEKPVSPKTKFKSREIQPVDKNLPMKPKIMALLYKQQELLKKDILRKRALLERELQYEIQREVAEELAARTKLERSKQDEVRTGSNKRKSSAISTTTVATPQSARQSRHTKQPRHIQQNTPANHQQPKQASGAPSNNQSRSKREKLYCLCRTPYDETKFYVGCDLCNNWFHGDCVGITEESSKTLTEFVCNECKQASDSEKLYCLCQQPYDNSQFYICCDSCQDWFHGRCVGILQSEADNIDEYVCPRCQNNSSVNFANMKDLTAKDYDGLKKLIKQLQAHKSAWPFMEPVDPTEAPDYYKVIKEPMDLQRVEQKINDHLYMKLSDFIGDMTKIFDNCRYYNPKESPFYKCAETLEAYFVNKIKCFRDKLYETK